MRSVLASAAVAIFAFVPVASAAHRGADRAATPVPILMYHVVGETVRTPFPDLTLSRRDFASEVTWLARHGYHGVTLAALYEHWQHGAPLPRKPVVLTFDDGYPGDVDVVLPLLRRLGWPGVLNLHIGNLTPSHVRKLVAAGWEIDSHTFSHSDLTAASNRQLEHDVSASRTWIRNVFRQRVLFFAYPSGRYDARVVAAVRAAGYVGAVTTQYGLASPREGMYTLHRIRVRRGETGATLGAELTRLEAAR